MITSVHTKIFVLFFVISMPFSAFAKYYDATLVLSDTTAIDVFVKFPIMTIGKNIVVKRTKDGDSEKIARKNIKLITIFLNDKKDKRALLLLKKVYGDLLLSKVGFKYIVKKKKRENKLFLVYHGGDYGYGVGTYISKKYDSII